MNTHSRRLAAASLLVLMAGVFAAPATALDDKMYGAKVPVGEYAYLDTRGLPPMSHSDGARIYALQQIADMDLSHTDLLRILPRLMDLSAAEQTYRARVGALESSLVQARPGDMPVRVMFGGTETTGPSAYSTVSSEYSSRIDDIWNDIANNVDTDKASRLRRLVTYAPAEPRSMTAFWQGMRRIDTMLAQWDAYHSARIAGTTPPPFENVDVTITRLHVSEPDPIWAAPPTISTDTLIQLLTWRLASLSGKPYFFTHTPTRADLDVYRFENRLRDPHTPWFQLLRAARGLRAGRLGALVGIWRSR